MCGVGPLCRQTPQILIFSRCSKMIKQRNKKLVVTKFRTTSFEKKIIKINAKKAGLSVSRFCRNTLIGVNIKANLSDDEIQIYKMLVKYSNNFTAIGNMFKNRDPNLSKEVYALAREFKIHLQNFQK